MTQPVTQPVTQADQPAKAALLVLAAALLFALMGALVKRVSVQLPSEMVVFFRSFTGWLLTLPWVFNAGRGILSTRRMHLHLLRAVLGVAAMYCFFYALAHMRLADALLLNYAAPLYIPVIAGLWLAEPVPARLRWALLTGFLGVLLVLKPGLGIFQAAGLIACLAGVFTAAAFVCIRYMGRTEPAVRTVFYFGLFASLITFLPMLRVWRMPAVDVWLDLLAIGLLATVAQLALTRGYALAPAARVAPFNYSTVLFGGLLGWLWWQETPDGIVLTGMGLVVTAGVLAARLQTATPR